MIVHELCQVPKAKHNNLGKQRIAPIPWWIPQETKLSEEEIVKAVETLVGLTPWVWSNKFQQKAKKPMLFLMFFSFLGMLTGPCSVANSWVVLLHTTWTEICFYFHVWLIETHDYFIRFQILDHRCQTRPFLRHRSWKKSRRKSRCAPFGRRGKMWCRMLIAPFRWKNESIWMPCENWAAWKTWSGMLVILDSRVMFHADLCTYVLLFKISILQNVAKEETQHTSHILVYSFSKYIIYKII